MKRSFSGVVAASFDALDAALRPKILWSVLLLLVFLLSAGISLTIPNRRAVVLWFPDARSASKPRAELRYVEGGLGVAEEASALVEELLLGPIRASSRPISVPSANIRSSIRSKKTLFIDVSSDILFGRASAAGVYEQPPLPPHTALDYLERSLRWNFPFYRIVLTIDGLEPSWEPAKEPEQPKTE